MSLAKRCRSLTILGITFIGQTAPALPPLQLLGTTQIDQSFTAYLQQGAQGIVFTLREGETADGWRIVETRRDDTGHVVRIRLQRDSTELWLAVAGGCPSAGHSPSSVMAFTAPEPLIDTPASKRGLLHDQLLHRSRLRGKPVARASHRQVSDLDPFPAKLSR